MVKDLFCIYYKIIDLFSFRFLCYFSKIRNFLLILLNAFDKKYNLNFVFYNKWGIGDNLHDICYLQELHNKGIISNPTIFIDKSFNSIKILSDIFPDINIKKFPPKSFFGLSLWQNQFRDIDKIKYDSWILKCSGLKKDFKYKNALYCAYKKLPKRINIANEIDQKDLIIGFKYGAKKITQKNNSILICNSFPLSGQASTNDVKNLEEMANFFSKAKVNVFLTKKLEFVQIQKSQRKYIHELEFSLADYLNDEKDYICVIGIATGPIWLALRKDILALLISKKDNFGKDFGKIKSFKNCSFLKESQEYKNIIEKIK